MSKVIYLVQGQSKLIKNYFDLRNRINVESIFLTFDQQIDGALYYPDSTWGEGRNYLLEKALESYEHYQYYIFLDDDVTFLQGDYEIFEKQLVRYHPAVAVPVFVPKTRPTVMGFNSWFNKQFIQIRTHQLCRFADAQFIAFHKDVIADKLVVPLQTHFDKVSWYATSSTQQLLMFNLYEKSILQFNSIKVKNECHRDYPKHEFKEIQKEWLNQQFAKPTFDPRQYARINKSFFSLAVLIDVLKKSYLKRSFGFIKFYFNTIIFTLMYKKKYRHSINKKKLSKIIHKDSVLFKQYNNRK